MAIQKKYLKTRPICKVTFTLPKEAVGSATKICIVGDFNGWKQKANPLKKLKNGSCKITLDLECGKEYQFRYLLDNVTWENDWAADKYTASAVYDTENSVVIV